MELISSLTTALHEFHMAGFCLSSFDESNLVVSENTREMLFVPVESKKVERPPDLPPNVFLTPGVSVSLDPGKLKFRDVEFQRSTPAGIQANYHDVHSFITKSLFQGEVPVPDDIKHLLRLMESPEAATMGCLVSRHPSLVCLGLRRGLVMTYIQYIRELLPFDFYYDVSTNKAEWCRSRWFKPYGGYTPDESEVVTAVTYPELMPKVQEGLFKANHLRKAYES